MDQETAKLDLKSKEIDATNAEKDFLEFLWQDDKAELISLSKKIAEMVQEDPQDKNLQETLNLSLASRLLHLACKLDSVECATALIDGEAGLPVHVNEMDATGRTPLHNAAEMNSVRCIDLLLRKQARTDLRSKDDNSFLALEIALASKRLQVVWTPKETVEELLVLLSERDLSGIKMLAESTRDVAEVAYVDAIKGRVAGLASLLMVCAEKVNVTMVYERVVRDAISLCQVGEKQLHLSGYGNCPDSALSNDEVRQLMLCEIELLQLFGAVAQGSCKERRTTSPLISACQAGDEAVVKLLLKTNINVNDGDGDGNSALHWCLKASSTIKESRLRIVLLLIRHGARVSCKNRLGLTPLHIAAANGNYQALQILLLRDPSFVDVPSETKETPLFLAVKNESMECARLLLRYGANTQALNLRKERPIDLAKSQDMRFILSSTSFGFSSHAGQMQEVDAWWFNDHETLAEMCGVLDMKEEAATHERYCVSAKMELCRYYESPSGCVRGSKCYFAHGEKELRRAKAGLVEFKQGLQPQAVSRNTSKYQAHVSEDHARKIFIGGLPPSVDSAYLREFFEREFGPVEDSIVIGSQAGDHVQSRGFGFITFKHEYSVAAAVQAHYVIILGKKVEIKDALPKLAFQSDLPKASNYQHQLAQEPQQTFGSNEKQPVDDGRMGSMTWVDKVMCDNSNGSQNENLAAKMGTTDQATSLPAWVATFRRWLPTFLLEVSKRLKEGECYPLSSLKGDFRATCGMELDHASLGFLKLSDFVRSFPGICRMRIVPVGRGPATHMVLLPSLPQPHTLSQFQKHPLSVGDVCLHSELDSFYKEHLPESGGFKPLQLFDPDNNEIEMLQSMSCSSYNGKTCTAFGELGWAQVSPQLSTDRFLSFLRPDRSFLAPWYTPSGGMETQEVDKERQLSSAKNKGADPPFSFFARQWDYYQKSKLSKGGSDKGSFDNQSGDKSSTNCLLCKEKKALWVNMPCAHKVLCTSCKSKHIPSGMCMQCHAPVQNFLFAPWDTLRPKIEAPAGQHYSNEPHLYPSPSSSQESPVNTVPAFHQLKVPPDSASDEDSLSKGSSGGSDVTCLLCKERKAVWANIPCGHKVLCSACKSGQLRRSTSCMTCHSHVENLISLYE